MKFALVAIFGVTAVVAERSHRHVHRHADKRLGSPVEGRSPSFVTTVVPGPTETVYELNGKELDPLEVASGLAAGIYVLVSDTSTSTSATASTSIAAAEFYQEPSTTSSSSSTPTTTTVAPPPPPPSTSSSTSSTSTQAAASSAAPSSNQGGTGLQSEFPSGTIPCSTFPSAYGPVYIDYLGMSGYIGIQNVPNYKPGIDTAISYISTAVVGGNSGCTANSYCSYACPSGYQKSQWPVAQGDVGQSVGGLYCNSNGMLELSRPEVKQLCVTGTGQVQVQSNLGAAISICRTDYPGTESETVPLQVNPNETHDITCPDAADYYMHQGSFTSAQYYINVQGVLPADACWWQTDSVVGPWHGSPGNIGNWAPVNMGVGKGAGGMTFISLIPNIPTNPTGTLDYNIKITGDVSGGCEYRGGQYYQDGNASPTGCTVSVSANGKATYVLS